MNRRRFILGAAAMGVAAPAIVPSVAKAAPTRLTLISVWPRDLPGLGDGAQRFADRLNAAADGSLEVIVVGPGEIAPPFESFDVVANGEADMYYGTELFWHGKSPAFSFFAGVPFGLTASEMTAWISHGGGQQLWDAVAADFNLKPFMAGNLGGQMGGWFNRRITTPDDLQGLKISIPGLAGGALRRVGADAVATPPGNLRAGLQTGFLDAATGFGPWIDLHLEIYDAAEHYYYPGFHQPGLQLSVGVNRDTWAAMTPQQQHLFTTVAAAESASASAGFDSRNATALRTLRRVKKVDVRPFPDSVLTAIGTAAGQVVAAAGDADGHSRRVYADFLEYRRRAMSWSKFSDQTFAEARLLPFRYT